MSTLVCTFLDDVIDLLAALMRHEAEHTEDDEAGKDAGAAVDQWDDQSVPGNTHQWRSVVEMHVYSIELQKCMCTHITDIWSIHMKNTAVKQFFAEWCVLKCVFAYGTLRYCTPQSEAQT